MLLGRRICGNKSLAKSVRKGRGVLYVDDGRELSTHSSTVRKAGLGRRDTPTFTISAALGLMTPGGWSALHGSMAAIIASNVTNNRI